MKKREYDVVIRRSEVCRVHVSAESKSKAIELALMGEASGEVDNYEYENEEVSAVIVPPSFFPGR